MAQITDVSLLALPGRVYTFVPKGEVGVSPKPSDRITAVSLLALPGRLYVFEAKTPVKVDITRRQFYRIRRTSRGTWREYSIEEN